MPTHYGQGRPGQDQLVPPTRTPPSRGRQAQTSPGSQFAQGRTSGGSGQAGVEQFMSAIQQLESGGNASARNSRTGAHGLFQIMPSNWSPWAQEAGLGPNPPRTPQNQRRIAAHKMDQYRRMYGSWDAAAVAWFAGPSRAERYINGDQSVLNLDDKGGGKHGKTVREYVDEIMGALGMPATGFGSGGSQQQATAAMPAGNMQAGAGEIGMFDDSNVEQETEGAWRSAIENLSVLMRESSVPELGEDLEPVEWARPNPSDPTDPRYSEMFEPPELQRRVQMPGDLGVPEEGPSPEQVDLNGLEPSTRGQEFVQAASEFVGTPYVWGGTTPDGFDCSGLIQYVAKRMGVELPRVSRDQARAGREVGSLDQAQAGDLVAFAARGLDIGHIGILAGKDAEGNWLMLHAPRTGKNVEIVPLNRTPATIRRVFGQGHGGGGGSVSPA